MATQFLPHNDPDLLLARQIGNYLDEKSELSLPEDSFTQALLSYKMGQTSAISSAPSINSNSIWERIEKETKPATKKETAAVHQIISKSKIWAVAASLLIAAFIGFGIYNYTLQQPAIIASSTQQIETVTLDDGSTVTLRPNSSLYKLSKKSGERSYRVEGEAFFEVTSDPTRTFSVEAGNGLISVLGTRFNLSTWGGQTQVYLEEGSISFQNLNTNSSVVLKPGESAKIEDDNSINTDVSSVSEFTDWMNRELIFTNKKTGYVFNELEQEFNFSITAPDSILNTTLSGGLSLTNAEQSLNDLSLVLDGEFIRIDKNTFKFVPNR